jgi:hypothetical protein
LNEQAKELAAALNGLIDEVSTTTAFILKARGTQNFGPKVIERVVEGYRPSLAPQVDPLRDRLIEVADLVSQIESTYFLSVEQRQEVEETIQSIELRRDIGELSEEEAEEEAKRYREQLAHADDPPGSKVLYEALEGSRTVLDVMDSVLDAGLAPLAALESSNPAAP